VGCAPKNYDYISKNDAILKSQNLNLKLYKQDTYYCAPASLATLLEHQKIVFSYDELIKKTFTPKLNGSLQLELKAATRSYGLIPYELVGNIESILGEISNKNPVLVLFNLGLRDAPMWHYAVALGYDTQKQEIFLSAPNGNKTWMSFEEFERFFEKGGKWAIAALKPPKIPTYVDEKEFIKAVLDMYEVGDKELAKYALVAYVSKNPNSLVAMIALGNIYFLQNDFNSAAFVYKKSLEIEAENPVVLNNLAISLLRQNKPKEAKKYAQKAIKLGGVFLQKYKNTLDEIEQSLKENR
jgi:tetratricopeptide (TPR) repeat protein